MAKKNNVIEFLQSLLDRLTPEDVDAMEQRGHDPEWGRQVMYVQFFLMEFTMWEADDIRIFMLTERPDAADDILRLFDFPWRRKWAVPWIDEAAAVQYCTRTNM